MAGTLDITGGAAIRLRLGSCAPGHRRLLNKRAQVAPTNVCLDHDAALAVVAADLVWPFAHLKPGQLA